MVCKKSDFRSDQPDNERIEREETARGTYKVLKKCLRNLTGGKYESLIVTEEGYFEAVTANGMRYPIVELSQATKEQAYISLRLALAASVT